MNKAARTLFLSVFVVLIVVGLLNYYGGPTAIMMGSHKPRALNYSQFRDEVLKGNVESATWQQSEITGTLKDGKQFTAKVVDLNSSTAPELTKILNDHNVNWKPEEPPISSNVVGFLSMFAFPILLFLAIYYFLIRPAQAGGTQALSFGRSRARRVGENGQKVTFSDVAGIDEAKAELFEIVDFLKNTKKYVALGAKIPKGILLTGPPGVGKTHLARAIAGEAEVPFFFISGSDFVEMFVGVGAARVRDLFETAKAHRPCVIFVDEIDAVGRQRGAGLGGGHDEREQTLNQLLVEMDGFEPNMGVVMIAATNRPDVLDPALLRPGRFDRQIVIDAPDALGREAILKIHAKGKPFYSDVSLPTVAKRTPGFTGADLSNVLNESALLAARNNQNQIKMHDIEEAIDRVVGGPQRKSRVITALEREVIACHEGGHAIVGELLEHCDPVHKVTILPRGMSLGSTWSRPEQDKYLKSEAELLDEICMTLGGRVAEETVYGEIWTGASSDLQKVTRIAKAMVCDFGMSPKLGALALGKRSKNPFLGRDYGYDERDYSEEVAKVIDEEIKFIVSSCYERTKRLLIENRDKLDRLVQELLEKETLDREAFLATIGIEDRKALPAAASAEEGGAKALGEGKKAEGARKRTKRPKFEPGPASGHA